MSNEPISKDHCGLDYWKERWVLNDIRFHKERNHPMLEKHLSKLTNEKSNCKIFFPLCGKAIDMVWLASIGHEIVGVDIAHEAMEQFFADNKIEHTIEDLGDFKLYKSLDNKIRLYLGDLFKLTPKYEGLFECVWDRGGLVALTPALRIQYSAHMQTLLAEKFRYLLDVFEYDQSLYPGPPHCVKLSEITDLYGKKCKIQKVDSVLVDSPTPLGPNLIEDNKPYENVYLLSEI